MTRQGVRKIGYERFTAVDARLYLNLAVVRDLKEIILKVGTSYRIPLSYEAIS